MSSLIISTFTGEYEPSTPEELRRADIVIGHEFAAPTKGAGVVNMAIARIIAENFPEKPIYAPDSVALALAEEHDIEVTGLLLHTSSNTDASEGGTWEELSQVKQMVGSKRTRSIHVGQAHHVGRIARQAENKKIGFEPLLPEGLPKQFDPESSQWWCRSVWAWALREIPGSLILRRRGHL